MKRAAQCEACGDGFNAKCRDGVWQRFCCRACFVKRPEFTQATCGECSCNFAAKQVPGGFEKYCSPQCRSQSRRRGGEFNCLNCGAVFYLPPSRLKLLAKPGCCSTACKHEFYKGTENWNFAAGTYTHTQDRYRMQMLPRPGYAFDYVGNHRLVASRAIGRMLTRGDSGECVLRINGNPEDDEPENLFICSTRQECNKRIAGVLPWPTESNLMTYSIPTVGISTGTTTVEKHKGSAP